MRLKKRKTNILTFSKHEKRLKVPKFTWVWFVYIIVIYIILTAVSFDISIIKYDLWYCDHYLYRTLNKVETGISVPTSSVARSERPIGANDISIIDNTLPDTIQDDEQVSSSIYLFIYVYLSFYLSIYLFI